MYRMRAAPEPDGIAAPVWHIVAKHSECETLCGVTLVTDPPDAHSESAEESYCTQCMTSLQATMR